MKFIKQHAIRRTGAAVAAVAAMSAVAAPAADAGPYLTWGAIAVGDNGKSGAIVTGERDSVEAKTKAEQACGYSDCQWLTAWPSNMCAAAARTSQGRWASEWGYTPQRGRVRRDHQGRR